MSAPSSAGLARKLGLTSLVAMGINGVVGSSIFMLPGEIARHMGAASPLAYLTTAGLLSLVVLCFAEAAGRVTRAGGAYVYALDAFGPGLAFQMGWFNFISRMLSVASVANALSSTLAYLLPGAEAGWRRALIMTSVIGVLAWVNFRGVAHGARSITVLTVAKLTTLVVFVLAGLPAVNPTVFTGAAAPTLAGWTTCLFLLVHSFSGFDLLAIPAGEATAPRRDVPRALLITIASVSVVYLAVQVVAQGALPTITDSRTPIASAAERFLGSAGGRLITVGAGLSMVGTLAGNMLSGPRVLFALAEDRRLPSPLAFVHPRTRTPATAIAIFTALVLPAALSSTFLVLAQLNALARLYMYTVVCASVLALRRSRRAAPSTFRIPGGPVVPVLGLLFCVTLMANASATQGTWFAGALLLGIGISRVMPGRAVRTGESTAPPG